MWTEKLKLGLLCLLMLGLTACGSAMQDTSYGSQPAPMASSSASGYGVVQSIDLVPRENAGLGLGTVAGAVVGGVLGSQVGSGSGRTAAAVAGAAGGALAGHQMERNARGGDQVYRVALRMDDGSLQTLIQESRPDLRVGERVRVSNGMIVERMN